MFQGGIPTGAISGIFGFPNIGKTWLAIQIACFCALPKSKGGLNKPSLILDTEGYYQKPVVRRLVGYFAKRFNVDAKSMLGKVNVWTITDLFKFMRMFGMELALTMSEATATTKGGKLSAQVDFLNKVIKDGRSKRNVNYLDASKVWEFINENNIAYLAVDSVSNILKSQISSTVVNLGARNDIMRPLVACLQRIATEKNIAVFTTHHISKNPMNPRDTGKPWGGDYLMYNLKYALSIRKGLKDQRIAYGDNVRRMIRFRYPGLLEETKVVMLAKDKGYMPVQSSTRGAG
jgi:RecA/RadA recombinase